LFGSFACRSSKNNLFPSADSITITGLVNKTITLSITDLNALPDTNFTSLKILNHPGEYKTTYQKVKMCTG
jgi:propanediol utilization protein